MQPVKNLTVSIKFFSGRKDLDTFGVSVCGLLAAHIGCSPAALGLWVECLWINPGDGLAFSASQNEPKMSKLQTAGWKPALPQSEIGNPAIQCTVIVLNWNGREHLPACLTALRRQTFRDFKTLLVDNGSADGSVDWARSEFPEVDLLPLRQNLGFAAGNNRAIRSCNTPWTALLNNDTEADPGWLRALMNAAASHPPADFFASQVRLFDRRDLLDSAGDGMPVAGASFKIGHLQPAELHSHSKYVFGASAAAAMYRTSMLLELDGFDEDFFCIYEDADLSFRAQLAGHRCLYVPQAIVYHKSNATLQRSPGKIVFYGQRNSEWLVWKSMPSRLLRKYRPLRIIYFVASFAYFALRGYAATFLRAKGAAWKERKRLLERRERLPRQQKVTDEYVDSLLERHWLRTRVAGKFRMSNFE